MVRIDRKFAVKCFRCVGFVLATLGSFVNGNEDSQCKAWLVQSIPTDLPELPRVHGVLSSGDVFQWLAGNASESLDITAQNWQLIAQPNNSDSGDYGYNATQLEAFGAPVGQAVFDSLAVAADRGISIRIAQHSGFYPDFTSESAQLAAGRPNVQNRTLLLSLWWGSGIIHSKVWIADKKHFYIGSANNDWKSFTQVKELGIYLSDCPQIAEQLEIYFSNLWTLTSLNASLYRRHFWDEEFQTNRTVPCWSHFLHVNQRCKSPLHNYRKEGPTKVLGYPYLADPSEFNLKIETWGSQKSRKDFSKSYLSFAPPELALDNYQTDEQGWVETILSVPVKGTVRINTMDWLGQSQFASNPVFWSVLSSAISKVVLAKQATVKVLAANWGHGIRGQTEYLEFLEYTDILCNAISSNKCKGDVELKLYEVPGFQNTGPALKLGNATHNLYPDYTRVNHGKYAVSDTRIHVGTSNLVWDYFYNTAGVSFGSYDPHLVSQLQAIFDADWNSPYAIDFRAASA